MKCPICGAEMILRKGIYGDFYGCSRYPECKGKRKIETEDYDEADYVEYGYEPHH